ncbi:hypothetical protein JXA70_10855 [candidate division KSB1 bacterium]|nr:hypothetical protein [candidate division KSB1 bacterium]
MMRRIFFAIACFGILSPFCLAQFRTALERQLERDIENYVLDDFRKIEAAFILSGANQQETLERYVGWYDNLLQTIRDYNFDPHDRVASASKVFAYLHSSWLITYKEEATTLIAIVDEKRYNCVAGTILYNLICEDLGWPTEAFETPTHTYTIFSDFGREITVENTSPIGFNMMRNLHDYNRYLLQFYPEEQRYQIGLDRIYAYENSKGRKIDNTELLGLLAYNRAYFANRTTDYKKAYDFVLLAQKFNRDSRSNYNFEINLYYRWGQQLYERKQFQEAFSVFADAYYRYWENKDFANNCKVAFNLAQRENWQKRDWDNFQQLTNEMLAIELLEKEDLDHLKGYMVNWLNLYQHTKPHEDLQVMINYWQAVFPGEPILDSIK